MKFRMGCYAFVQHMRFYTGWSVSRPERHCLGRLPVGKSVRPGGSERSGSAERSYQVVPSGSFKPVARTASGVGARRSSCFITGITVFSQIGS